MNETVPTIDIIIGVDTHKRVHAAVAVDALGTRLGTVTVPVDETGYQTLETWARSLGSVWVFGVEGNRRRRNSALGFLTPARAYEQMAMAA